MSGIYRVFIHEDQKAVVTVDLDRWLMPLYYGAEDASFAHTVLLSLSVYWFFIFCYLHMNF